MRSVPIFVAILSVEDFMSHPFGELSKKFLFLFVAFPLLLVDSVSFAQTDKVAKPPGLPKLAFARQMQDRYEIFWYTLDSTKNGTEYNSYRWDPESGQTSPLNLPKNAFPSSMVRGKQGLYLVGSTSQINGRSTYVGSASLLTTNGQVINSPPLIPRDRERVVLLKDDTLIITGGRSINANNEKRLTEVEALSYRNGKLIVNALPPLPFGNQRHGYALVGLADGRLMALGGDDSDWEGCMQCASETFLLDIKAKKWSKGPNMLQARSNMSATLLPDGKVLVIGGWSKERNGGGGYQIHDSTEIWDPVKNQFSSGSTLPSGVTQHHAHWIPGLEGKQLLIVSEKNRTVQSYDVQQNSAQFITMFDLRFTATNFAVFTIQKRVYLWALSDDINLSEKSTGSQFIDLNLNNDGRLEARSLIHPSGGLLGISGYQFRPGSAGKPSYALGGNTYESTNSIRIVQKVKPDGTVQTVNQIESDDDEYPPEQGDSIELDRLHMDQSGGNTVQEKSLKDGRKIVAGGAVQKMKIAVLSADSMQVNSVDRYVFVGPSSPAYNYEIYDPKTKTWKSSSDSQLPGERVAILNDGRVAKLGSEEVGDEKKKTRKTLCQIELSNEEGASWQTLPAQGNLSVALLHQNTRLFSVQNELFLAGRQGKKSCTTDALPRDLLQWFNQKNQKWETIWQMDLEDPHRPVSNRIIIKTLSNGKRLILPVAGY